MFMTSKATFWHRHLSIKQTAQILLTRKDWLHGEEGVHTALSKLACLNLEVVILMENTGGILSKDTDCLSFFYLVFFWGGRGVGGGGGGVSGLVCLHACMGFLACLFVGLNLALSHCVWHIFHPDYKLPTKQSSHTHTHTHTHKHTCAHTCTHTSTYGVASPWAYWPQPLTKYSGTTTCHSLSTCLNTCWQAPCLKNNLLQMTRST